MSFAADEEILQDFLVEAGEILESLGEQLVEMEQRPEDSDLLNSIFRGFHTVKGGAGFLQLGALVDCCHAAENVFDTLRKHERTVTAELMDTVLQALDAVNDMFAQVSNGEDPAHADPALIEQLHFYAAPESAEETPPATEPESPVVEESFAEDTLDDEPAAPVLNGQAVEQSDPAAESPFMDSSKSGEDITDQEFDQLLDALSGGGQGTAPAPKKPAPSPAEPAAAVPGNDSDEITDEEFEALLDQLHGKGQFTGAVQDEESQEQVPAKSASSANKPAPASDSDEITDDEFEALLDQLHGKGKFVADAVADTAEESPAAKEPAAKPKSETVTPAPAPKATQKPAAQTAKAPETPVNSAAAAKPASAPASEKPVPAPAAAKKAETKPPAEKAAAQETTVRVDTARLDDIMNMVGELVLVRNRLVRLGGQYSDEGLQKAVANLDIVTADLQTSVMKTRMQPIKKVFGRFPRVVRDLARTLKKEINLELIGEDTDLDKNLVEALADPLVHLVRNSVDHGIEAPDVREKAGKPRVGKVVLSAQQEGDHILLMIEDDGAGMDPDKLRALAVKRGLMDAEAADRLTDKECYALIFAPGFSTKEQISDVSGRGVGMDVVKTKISQLNGAVDIESAMGQGTQVAIKVPLTLAIMPTLMVMLEDQAFALPLVNVNEIFHLDISKTNIVDGKEVVMVRGKPLPLYNLGNWLVNSRRTLRDHEESTAHVVVVSVGTQRVGFIVDQLVGQEEVVIKPLGKMLHGTPGLSGATITGDGRIAVILDVPSLLKHYA